MERPAGIIIALFIILLGTGTMSAGCTGAEKSGVAATPVPGTVPAPAESPAVPVTVTPETTPVPAATEQPVNLTGTVPILVPVPENTTSPTPTATFPQFPDPYIRNLGYSELYESDISNCLMQEAFPEIAGDPMYGLKNVRDLKLTTVSPRQMQQFERDYLLQNDTSKIFISTHCYGLPDTPYWNFLEVKGLLLARNSRPATYNITLVIKYQGVDGPEITTSQTFLPDQELPYYLYIPIPANDAGYITGMKFEFSQTG